MTTIESGCEDRWGGTFIFATLAKFIFVVDDSSGWLPDAVTESFVLVRTSTMDVVRMFDANGLYSPAADDGGAATSKEEELDASR